MELNGDGRLRPGFFVHSALDLFSSHKQCVGWNAFHQEYIRPDRAAGTDNGISPQDDSIGVDDHIVLDLGVTLDSLDDITMLILLEATCAEGDAVVELHTVSDDAGFADNHAGTVIDEKMRADFCSGMNIDSRATVSPLGHHAREKGNLCDVEQMSHPLDGNRFEAGIGQDNFLKTTGCGVSRKGGLHIGL